ncbi:MAG TPA: hypothetical protein VNS58_30370 [Puia sp.]|nr:hypothetical protein [Puia sp.]
MTSTKTSAAASTLLVHSFLLVFLVLGSRPANAAPTRLANLKSAAPVPDNMTYTVSMNTTTHLFHVVFRWAGIHEPLPDFRMPAWMPGYYQLIDYAGKLQHFEAADEAGKPLPWEKTTASTWRVSKEKASSITLSYDIDVSTPMPAVPNVAQSLLDSTHAFIAPTTLFLYPEGYIHHPVLLHLVPPAKGDLVATGLDTIAGKKFTYTAPDFDILYDCPILVGPLEALPSFQVRGIPHYFIGYQLGDFDRQQFMADLKKVVEAGIAVIGDIPYRHYTFLATGPGRGGVEHLNSTTVPFSGAQLSTASGRHRLLNFLAHEYFHLYNVKRIRPVALGPFDYSQEDRTNMLWVSEGFTVYYEYLSVRRAGLMTGTDLLHDFQSNIAAYENKPGHLYQSATQASYETWADGPLVKPEAANRTISYYDKGPALGMLLDFAIRHATNNQKSLDDVMRELYHRYYQEKKRGFTDAEFRQVCERLAGISLSEIFEYASTVKDVDYSKYLAYAGLAIDLGPQEQAGSPQAQPGAKQDSSAANQAQPVPIPQRSFKITPLPNPDALQLSIRKSWLGE